MVEGSWAVACSLHQGAAPPAEKLCALPPTPAPVLGQLACKQIAAGRSLTMQQTLRKCTLRGPEDYGCPLPCSLGICACS
jgi:hypothetical protein